MKSESIVSSTGSKAAKSTAATSIRKSVKSTAQAKSPAAKPAPVTPITAKAPPAPKGAPVKVVDAPQSVILGPVMRKKELIDTVVEQTGRKKKDVMKLLQNFQPYTIGFVGQLVNLQVAVFSLVMAPITHGMKR